LSYGCLLFVSRQLGCKPVCDFIQSSWRHFLIRNVGRNLFLQFFFNLRIYYKFNSARKQNRIHYHKLVVKSL